MRVTLWRKFFWDCEKSEFPLSPTLSHTRSFLPLLHLFLFGAFRLVVARGGVSLIDLGQPGNSILFQFPIIAELLLRQTFFCGPLKKKTWSKETSWGIGCAGSTGCELSRSFCPFVVISQCAVLAYSNISSKEVQIFIFSIPMQRSILIKFSQPVFRFWVCFGGHSAIMNIVRNSN